ncbi:MAG: hypothetical protein WD008_03845 [Balneolaceae bacterium]
MKQTANKFPVLFSMFTLLFLISTGCTGERGPVGPEGSAGPEIIPVSFEFEADMIPENDFEFFADIPGSIEVFDSDVMLAYVLEDFIPEDDLEVWRQLPLTEFNSNGTILINFDFTAVDIRVFLDANYPLGASDGYEGLVIRAVHVPADLVSAGKTEKIRGTNSVGELETVLGMKVKPYNLE